MTDHQQLPAGLFLIGIAAMSFLIAMFAPQSALTVVAGCVTAAAVVTAARVLRR